MFGVALAALILASCGSSGKGPATLNWYVFPEPSGSFATAAANCSKASGGKYQIKINLLSTASDQQRVSLVRRLAAGDSSIDILAMDVDWTAEFATAKWIRPWPAAMAAQETNGDLAGPIATATWRGQLYAGPINSNTELLWYRKDLVPNPPKTWDEMITDAIALAKQGKPHYIEEQGAQYEGLVVWFNSLVDSAGGQIVTSDNKVVVGPSTKLAASLMHRLATSPAADPSLNTDKEDDARVSFEKGTAAFEINYPFVWPAAAKAGIQSKMGYALFPTVTPGTDPKVSIGGYNLAVSAYSKHPQEAFDAITCLTQPANQVRDAIKGGLAPVSASIYDEPSIAQQYPFHALLKAQIQHYGIRPTTPAYADVSLAIQKALSPTSSIQPNTVVTTLRDEIKKALSSGALL
ncbi:MAG: ABC transporter substrate-binding protein [Solirubrobacterales bacterium]|nr:ABC transporter substrate-binding protein [Solirubrobacterales bacterium]